MSTTQPNDLQHLGYDVTWVQADGFYRRHFTDLDGAERFADKLSREDRGFVITPGKS